MIFLKYLKLHSKSKFWSLDSLPTVLDIVSKHVLQYCGFECGKKYHSFVMTFEYHSIKNLWFFKKKLYFQTRS
jgi:hypothetical protein